MSKNLRFFSVISILAVVFLACNLPTAGVPTPAPTLDPNALYTAAAQTVEAHLTQSAPGDTPIPSPTEPPSATPLGTNTPLPTNTPVPSPTPICDKVEFVSETIPDGTNFAPGAAFTKIWRLKNAGVCKWTTAYALVFDSGNAMGASSPVYLTGDVLPGQTVEIQVPMTAPATAGTYTGYWKMRNAAGVLFAKVWVKIDVIAPATFTPTTPGPVVTYKFIDQAPSAQWLSGGDSSAECPGTAKVLTFGGPNNDPCGFAMYIEGSKVEGGTVPPGKILEMHPKWVDNGVISGLFPVYTVQSGDRFRAQLGFLLKADGTCGVGNVVFQLNYKVGSTLNPLGSWSESCDGTLRSVDVDLSGIVGQTVQFAFAVLANGSAAQDWAVWIAPRVER
ncbi:MAG: NBR1-Ig-like domain-containing protein [Anaerolineales bacterium]|nr:NBR1-Ig-like domain-containing protein [Anaerolineales bacterium]